MTSSCAMTDTGTRNKCIQLSTQHFCLNKFYMYINLMILQIFSKLMVLWLFWTTHAFSVIFLGLVYKHKTLKYAFPAALLNSVFISVWLKTTRCTFQVSHSPLNKQTEKTQTKTLNILWTITAQLVTDYTC